MPLKIRDSCQLLVSFVDFYKSEYFNNLLLIPASSITVILVSEIGDKTFFIAAILAMRNNKLIVFVAALSALYLMTILSALLGWVVTTFIPREVDKTTLIGMSL